MKRDVQRFFYRYIPCTQVMSIVLPYGLYTILLVPKKSWVDISLDFILCLPRPKRGRDCIFILADMFSKMIYFIFYHKTNDATNLITLFFREIVWPYRVLRSIMFDHYVKFLSYF